MGEADGGRTGGGEGDQMERQHVVVVNNAPELLDLMRELLQDERYNVMTTNFVPETFDQIAALRPALLVVDLAVGHRAGWDLLERLQEDAVTDGIPVVVTSTDPRLLDDAKAQQGRYGGKCFLAKPYDLDAVMGAIRGLIGPA